MNEISQDQLARTDFIAVSAFGGIHLYDRYRDMITRLYDDDPKTDAELLQAVEDLIADAHQNRERPAYGLFGAGDFGEGSYRLIFRRYPSIEENYGEPIAFLTIAEDTLIFLNMRNRAYEGFLRDAPGLLAGMLYEMRTGHKAYLVGVNPAWVDSNENLLPWVWYIPLLRADLYRVIAEQWEADLNR